MPVINGQQPESSASFFAVDGLTPRFEHPSKARDEPARRGIGRHRGYGTSRPKESADASGWRANEALDDCADIIAKFLGKGVGFIEPDIRRHHVVRAWSSAIIGEFPCVNG